jgi:predicted O-methyltransferase YrrM
MNHFYNDINGWFTFPRFYKAMANRFESGATLIEVGTYKGQSFSYLIVEAINAGKTFDFIAIDACPWPDVEPDFTRNMEPLKDHYRTLFGGDSFDRANDFEDGSIDFVFLDANHSYEFISKDIAAWLPKIKKGGILAGHDYDPKDWPGVIQAVKETFGDDFNKEYLDEVVWYKVI